MENEREDIMSQIDENMAYLEKSNELINNVKKYYEGINNIENVEEMESEENA